VSVFGNAGGGGRRRASREELPLPAVVSTIQESRVVVLVDLSSTGVRLRGSNLPPEGEALWVKIENVRRFGLVAWSEHGECGVEFDIPIRGHEASRLRKEVQVATLLAGSVQQMLALQDWETGFAR
jgi:PilZ domain